MKIGQRQLGAGQERTFTHDLFQRRQAHRCARKSDRDFRFIRLSVPFRDRNSLDIDVPDQCAVGVGVEDAGELG